MGSHDSQSGAPADWYGDPMGRHQFRYWDGTCWTHHVANDGEASADPLEDAPGGQPSGEVSVAGQGGSAGVDSVHAAGDASDPAESSTDQAVALLRRMMGEAKAAAPDPGDALSTLPPGAFLVRVVDDPSTALLAHGTFNAPSEGTLVLSALAGFSPRSGRTELAVEDCQHRGHELSEVQQPALIYVNQQTLAYLKQDDSLWKRVSSVE